MNPTKPAKTVPRMLLTGIALIDNPLEHKRIHEPHVVECTLSDGSENTVTLVTVLSSLRRYGTLQNIALRNHGVLLHHPDIENKTGAQRRASWTEFTSRLMQRTL